MKRNKGMIILFLTPAVFMFSVIFLYPIIRTVIMSFFRIDGITDPVVNVSELIKLVGPIQSSGLKIISADALNAAGKYQHVISHHTKTIGRELRESLD